MFVLTARKSRQIFSLNVHVFAFLYHKKGAKRLEGGRAHKITNNEKFGFNNLKTVRYPF